MLHDGLPQVLAVASIKLDSMARNTGDPKVGRRRGSERDEVRGSPDEALDADWLLAENAST